jgi:hypothetical protein
VGGGGGGGWSAGCARLHCGGGSIFLGHEWLGLEGVVRLESCGGFERLWTAWKAAERASEVREAYQTISSGMERKPPMVAGYSTGFGSLRYSFCAVKGGGTFT